jgi:hypothetical protein
MTRTLSFLVGLVICSAVASAQFGDASVSAGYENFSPQHSSGLPYSRDGAYLDGDFAWRVPGPVPLMVGFGASAAGTWDTQNYPFVNNNGNRYYYNNLYSDVEDFELEPRIALNFRIPGYPAFVIRPRIGAGLLVSNYSIDTPQFFNNGSNFYIYTQYFTGAAFEVHPDIEAGLDWRGFSAGLDLSYMAAWGGFGAFGNEAQFFRAGLYLRLRF